jgi:TPR repeat protein
MADSSGSGAVGEKTEWDDVSLAELKGAAFFGNAGAQCALGKRIKEEDAAGAVRWFRAGAVQGHAGAQNALGECFHDGEGVDQDDAKAASWYHKAAEQGHATAQLNLGSCFENGEGVDPDIAILTDYIVAICFVWALVSNAAKEWSRIIPKRRACTARRPSKDTIWLSSIWVIVSTLATGSTEIVWRG